jgi:hypothetical protein
MGSASVKISDDREPLQWHKILLLLLNIRLSDLFHTSAIAESVTVIKMTSLFSITSFAVLKHGRLAGAPDLPYTPEICAPLSEKYPASEQPTLPAPINPILIVSPP